MNDDLFGQRMRAADVLPEEPDRAFVDRLYRELAVELGHEGQAGRERSDAVGSRRWRPGRVLLAAALLVPLTVGAMLVGAALVDRPVPDPEDLLAVVRAEGRIDIAVPRDHPQVVLPGGALAGFDIDVAGEIAHRMGLEGDITPVTAASLLAADRPWDLALASTMFDDVEAEDVMIADRVYYWPIAIVVRTDSPATTLGDLSGARLGVTAGLSGDRWLRGEAGAPSEAQPTPPLDVVRVEVSSDLACLEQLDAQEVDGCIAVTLGPADLAARPSVRSIGPAPTDVRGAVLRRAGPGADALAAEIRRVVGEAREDGTLSQLSMRRFGLDLTAPPST